ncbi:hypothetical protein QQZ08_004673 [Neonectria magnoliae]|uniref:Uncharacterized protein n=1 Tax=Neonectria magnoliae TaxID=2732573 RepID=A0ABR1I7B1_9HYPO
MAGCVSSSSGCGGKSTEDVAMVLVLVLVLLLILLLMLLLLLLAAWMEEVFTKITVLRYMNKHSSQNEEFVVTSEEVEMAV